MYTCGRSFLQSYSVKPYLLESPFLILLIIPHITACFRDQMGLDDLIGTARAAFKIQRHTFLLVHLQLAPQTGSVYILFSFSDLS